MTAGSAQNQGDIMLLNILGVLFFSSSNHYELYIVHSILTVESVLLL